MNHTTRFIPWRSHALCRLLVCATLLLPVSSMTAQLSESGAMPTKEQLLEQAGRCRSILESSLVKFYLPACVDTQNGGYFEVLRDGKFASNGERFLTLQTRQLWFFSTLAVEGIEREKSLAAAKAGYDFIQSKMLDSLDGGYFSKVTDAGAPRDTRKHVYLNSFAIYGLTAYYRATKNAAALDAAKRVFSVLEAKAYDRAHGGYNEFFYTDWMPVTNPRETGYVGAIGHKTYNTHLHILEAFAALYRLWPDPLLAKRLQELILINTSTVRYPKVECNVDAFLPDWRVVNTPKNLRASYGHDVECAWLTIDAARALGGSADPLRNWAEALCRTSIEFGFDHTNGGFYASGPVGKPADDTHKVWWVQAEALVSMLDMFALIGQPDYHRFFSKTLDFVERHQVAKEGSWWATRAAEGSAIADSQRTSPWQGAYHAGRAMLLCAKQLKELADRAGSKGGGQKP